MLKIYFNLIFNYYSCTFRTNVDREIESLSKMLKEIVHDCQLKQINGKEMCYSLPLNSISQFGVLFQNLENASKQYGVESLDLSMNTLEEVFLKSSK